MDVSVQYEIRGLVFIENVSRCVVELVFLFWPYLWHPGTHLCVQNDFFQSRMRVLSLAYCRCPTSSCTWWRSSSQSTSSSRWPASSSDLSNLLFFSCPHRKLYIYFSDVINRADDDDDDGMSHQPYLPISVEEVAAISCLDHWTNRSAVNLIPSYSGDPIYFTALHTLHLFRLQSERVLHGRGQEQPEEHQPEAE